MEKQPTVSEVRHFIFILSGILVIFALYPVLKSGTVRYWIMVPALVLMVAVIVRPQWIKPLYITWIALGDLIGSIISKIILLILFYCIFTPVSLFLKLLKKDPLHKTIDNTAETYWTVRETPPGSMKNQF